MLLSTEFLYKSEDSPRHSSPFPLDYVFGHQDNPTHLKKWPKVVVISYKMLHHLRQSLVGRDWNFLIIDEFHHLRCSKKISEAEETEDRAHRQGQKNAVNIFYFCAKDTVDDTRWPYLNTSLFRVAYTTNGKRDAIREIGVDDISYFKSSDLYDGILNKTLGKSTFGLLYPQHRTESRSQQNAVLCHGCNETNLSNNVSDN